MFEKVTNKLSRLDNLCVTYVKLRQVLVNLILKKAGQDKTRRPVAMTWPIYMKVKIDKTDKTNLSVVAESDNSIIESQSIWKFLGITLDLMCTIQYHINKIYRKASQKGNAQGRTLHKKWSFPLRIFLVSNTKSTVSCKFGHIYWRNP